MLTGSIVATVTPMDEEGNVCRASLKKLIDYHIASGTSAIVPVGTTDESVTLNHGGHADVTMITLELADGRISVIAGIGVNATAEIINLTQRFNDSGIVGCLTATPYYSRPSQEGLYQHLKVIAEHTDLLQILYNVPSRIGCGLLPETMGHLVKVENTIGIREATGNLTRINQLKKLVSDDFVLLSGDDTSALDFMQLGGHGVISITTNTAMRDTTWICKLAAEGHFAEARIISQRLMSLRNRLSAEPNPIPVKWVCKEPGLVVTDTLRLPMTPITDNGHETVRAVPKHTGLL